MEFPSTFDFLDAFGLEPLEEDPTLAYCRYVKKSSDCLQELDVSFSGVAESFQVIFRCGGKEVVTLSSEKVKMVQIRRDQSGAGLHVSFDLNDVSSEAIITLEPVLHCRWWLLRS
ncbi:hypothetical protein AL520_30050 [Achromobacter xylosoxidans]|nr:hypothetical protein AL520_30050 [Achromobacter xylosoxidans]